jgi:hypothetical protein
LYLLLSNCGGADDRIIPHSYATIEENLIINMIDTSRYIHYIEGANGYQRIDDSIKITKIINKIDGKGHFKELNKTIK